VLVTVVPDHDDEVSYRIPIAPRLLPCSALEPARELPGPFARIISCPTVRDVPEIAFIEGDWVALSSEPGGPAFVEISRRMSSLSLPVMVSERRGEHAGIVIDSMSGTQMEGWVPASALVLPEQDEDSEEAIFAGPEPTEAPPIEVCTSAEPLVLHARSCGCFIDDDEAIGRIAPGTPFAVSRQDHAPGLAIGPVSGRIRSPLALNLDWRVHPDAPLSCTSQTRSDASWMFSTRAPSPSSCPP
jgi:hypothetical protein